MSLSKEISVKVLGLIDDDVDVILHYEMRFSNGESATAIDFYGSNDEFKLFGKKLAQFPRAVSDKVVFETADDEVRYSEYLKLEVFCFEPNGTSAMRVYARRNSKAPYFQHCEFFIQALPADINRLGLSLMSWDPLAEAELVWPKAE